MRNPYLIPDSMDVCQWSVKSVKSVVLKIA